MSTESRRLRMLRELPTQLYYYFRLRTVRYVITWLGALAVCTYAIRHGWHAHDAPERPDGNSAHTFIDFGGQWLAGRMLIEGHGKQLYHRDVQATLLDSYFHCGDDPPKTTKNRHASDQLLDWLVYVKDTEDPPIGGPLYPPIHAFYYAPIAMLRPQPAYRTFQIVLLLLLLLNAFAINRISRGKIWTPVAVVFVYCFPGFSGAMNLGQNPPLTLALVLWGWVALTRNRPILAGILWGLLAFKPVWAFVLCLVPLLGRRWKMLTAMILTGLFLIVITLPFVGVQSWRHWISIGQQASKTYDVDYNWIQLSRDWLGLTRRWMIQFHDPSDPDRYVTYEEKRQNWLMHTVLGFAMLGFVLEATVRRAWLDPNGSRSLRGPAACLLLLGAIFSCYHYIYYGLLLAALPVCLLLVRPADFVVPRFRRQSLATTVMRDYFRPRLPERYPLSSIEPRPRWVWNSFVLCLVIAVSALHQWEWSRWGRFPDAMIPWEQFGLILLWLWCCVTWTTGTQSGDGVCK